LVSLPDSSSVDLYSSRLVESQEESGEEMESEDYHPMHPESETEGPANEEEDQPYGANVQDAEEDMVTAVPMPHRRRIAGYIENWELACEPSDDILRRYDNRTQVSHVETVRHASYSTSGCSWGFSDLFVS
jgi:hypothetical protein